MIRRLFLLLLAALTWIPVLAAIDDADGPAQLRRFLDGLEGLQARFEQQVVNQDGTRSLRSSGTFYLQRPDRFRWDYDEPERQQIVADGRQVWFYDPDLEQVSVQFQRKALRGTPAQLLSGRDPVENSFEISDGGRADGLTWVRLVPRSSDSQFETIRLGFADGELRRMEMTDKFGQQTRFRFFDIRHNPRFDSTFFRFEPPENVDLYNQ